MAKGINTGKLVATVSSPVFIYSVLAIIILITINSFIKRLGTQDKEFKEESDKGKLTELQLFNQFNSTELFNPNYWKNRGKENELISDVEARRLATKLDNAFWSNAVWTWDDVPEIYGVFDSINYKVNVSQIADEYLQLTGESLRGRIKNNLKALEISNIMRIINEKL